MATVQYTGLAMALTVGSQTIANGYLQSVTIDEVLEIVDASGAGDSHRRSLGTLKQTTVSFTALVSKDEADLMTDVAPSTTPIAFTFYPYGSTAGNTKIWAATVDAVQGLLVTSRSASYPYDNVVAVTVSGTITGGLTHTTA